MRARAGALAVMVAACGRIDFQPDLRPDCADAAPGEACMTLMLGPIAWQDAVDACAALDPPAHLATLRSAADNAAAATLAARIPFGASDTSTNQRQRMWLGGDSLAVVGQWEWITGEPFDYTNWRPGQPGTPTIERCLILLGSQDGQWDDRPCTYLYDGFVCERE